MIEWIILLVTQTDYDNNSPILIVRLLLGSTDKNQSIHKVSHTGIRNFWSIPKVSHTEIRNFWSTPEASQNRDQKFLILTRGIIHGDQKLLIHTRNFTVRGQKFLNLYIPVVLQGSEITDPYPRLHKQGIWSEISDLHPRLHTSLTRIRSTSKVLQTGIRMSCPQLTFELRQGPEIGFCKLCWHDFEHYREAGTFEIIMLA